MAEPLPKDNRCSRCGEWFHNAHACPVQVAAAPQAPSGQQAEPIDRQSLIDWVAEQWHAQVANRPMVNVHRRALDDTWRLMLRHLGVDDRARLGPTHDELRAEIGSKEWEALAGQQSERPAPAGQAVGALDNWARSHEFHNTDEMNGAFMAVNKLRALAASQAERPAVKEDGNG